MSEARANETAPAETRKEAEAASGRASRNRETPTTRRATSERSRRRVAITEQEELCRWFPLLGMTATALGPKVGRRASQGGGRGGREDANEGAKGPRRRDVRLVKAPGFPPPPLSAPRAALAAARRQPHQAGGEPDAMACAKSVASRATKTRKSWFDYFFCR